MNLHKKTKGLHSILKMQFVMQALMELNFHQGKMKELDLNKKKLLRQQ